MADDKPEPVIINAYGVTRDEARKFEQETSLTFAEALALVTMNRISTLAAEGLLRMARSRPGGSDLPDPKGYIELLNLFENGRIVVEFTAPKAEAPS